MKKWKNVKKYDWVFRSIWTKVTLSFASFVSSLIEECVSKFARLGKLWKSRLQFIWMQVSEGCRMRVVLLLSEELDTSRHQEQFERRTWLWWDFDSAKDMCCSGKISWVMPLMQFLLSFKLLFLVVSVMIECVLVYCELFQFIDSMIRPWDLGLIKAWQDR